MKKICEMCNLEYESHSQAYGQKFCSLTCRRKSTVNRMKEIGTYSKYKRKDYDKHKDAYKLRSKIHKEQERFSGFRDAVLERDEHKCQMCGSDYKLEVHHIDGNGRGEKRPNNSLDNLQTLCAKCHCLQTQKDCGRYVNIDMTKVKTEMQGCNTIMELAEKLNVNHITLGYKMRKSGILILHKKSCEICGNEFEVSSIRHYKKYCSQQCNTKAGYIAEQKKKDESRETVSRLCLICGNDFEVNKYYSNQKFCSKACGIKHSHNVRRLRNNVKQ